jgi:hypothetical protein
MGRLRRYKTYEFINDGEEPIVKSYKHNMSNIKMKDLIKRYHKGLNTTEHLKLGLPLPLNKDSKLIGVIAANHEGLFLNLGSMKRIPFLIYS